MKTKNKSIFLVLILSLISLSACTTNEKKLSGTLVGAAGGAAKDHCVINGACLLVMI